MLTHHKEVIEGGAAFYQSFWSSWWRMRSVVQNLGFCIPRWSRLSFWDSRNVCFFHLDSLLIILLKHMHHEKEGWFFVNCPVRHAVQNEDSSSARNPSQKLPVCWWKAAWLAHIDCSVRSLTAGYGKGLGRPPFLDMVTCRDQWPQEELGLCENIDSIGCK